MGHARVGTLPAVMLVIAPACSSSPPAPSPPPASTGPPANAVVDGLVAGEAHAVVTGDIEQAYDWELLGASDDPDTTVITWGQGLNSFDLLAMPGAIVEGEFETSLDLWMDLRLDAVYQRFLSEAGECSISLTEVGDGRLRGEVGCDRLTSENGSRAIGLSVAFSAGPRG